MANWFQIACNEIISAVRGTAIVISDKLRYRTSYTAIDFLDDELITKRGVLGLIAGAGNFIISVPAGSAIPFLVDMTDPVYSNVLPTFTAQIELLIDGNFASATKTREVYDVQVEKDFIDNNRITLSQLEIYGYPNDTDGLTTQFDLILIIK